MLIDLGRGRNRLGGSALAQVYRQIGDTAPDIEDALSLKALCACAVRSDDALMIQIKDSPIAKRFKQAAGLHWRREGSS
mgnify:CR=1 FL=1